MVSKDGDWRRRASVLPLLCWVAMPFPFCKTLLSNVERNGDEEEADDGDGMDEGDCGKAAR